MKRSALLLVVSGLMGCSEGTPSALCSRPCAEYEICVFSDACTSPPCAQVCTKICETNTDCAFGHRCIQRSDRVVCSDRCETELCPIRQTCSGATGTCIGVGCSSDTDCTDMQFCDPSSRACYPLDGVCDSYGRACRSLPTATATQLRRVCEENACRVIPLSMEPPSDAPNDAAVLTPIPARADAQFASTATFGFTWSARGQAMFAFVTEDVPKVMSDVSNKAIWADALAAGESSTAWAKGVAVSGGKWGTSPGTPPLDRTLFFTLVAIEATTIKAISKPTPFIFGSWRPDGGACTDEGVIDGQCRHPAGPRVCASGACRTICESHAQCASPQLCGRATGPLGLRLCGG